MSCNWSCRDLMDILRSPGQIAYEAFVNTAAPHVTRGSHGPRKMCPWDELVVNLPNSKDAWEAAAKAVLGHPARTQWDRLQDG